MTRLTRRILVALGIALLVVAAAATLGLAAKRVAATAADGKAEAEAGAHSLAALDATRAVQEFREANRSFASLSHSLGPEWVAAAAGSVPWAGRQYLAARTLARIGIDGSTAGLELAEALHETPSVSASASPTGRLGALLATGRNHADAALSALTDANDRVAGLSADGLVAPLANAVRTAKAALGQAAPFLDRSHALLQLESYLTSGDHRVLVVSQDGAELRPTGGWAGSFGVIDIGPGGAKLETYRDSSVLPDPAVPVKPPAGALQTSILNFRNANWWIDFPTSARSMLGFWRNAGQPPVDGIIVVDTVAMKDLLAVLGPVAVPSYGETFTSENLLQRLLYLVEVQRGGATSRKNVLAALAAEVEQRMLTASPSELARAAFALAKAADAKHVQMYFADPQAEAVAESLGWSGQVAPPRGTTDLVAISNAMNEPGKVNVAMRKTIDYTVELETNRSAQTTLVLEYSNTGPYPLPMPSVFRDWLRVYRLPGTIFPSSTPDGAKTVVLVESGLPAEARMFTLLRGQSRTETFVSRVPNAMAIDAAPAAGGGKTARYRLHVVRQADLEDVPTSIEVAAPTGWRATSADARLTASGASLPVTVRGDGLRVAVPLSGDLDLDMRLASP